jgi:antitoxin (DNA-binding transcriptional repressor) of toxin-antitoxin stability system
VKRARGKEVVITVRGKETAKLAAVPKRKNATKKNDWPNWMNCTANRARELTGYTSLLLPTLQPMN